MLTLWAAVVAERPGFGRDEALSPDKAVSGLTARNKKTPSGHFQAGALISQNSAEGVRTVGGAKAVEPEGAQSQLESKFGDGSGLSLPETRRRRLHLRPVGVLRRVGNRQRLPVDRARVVQAPDFRVAVRKGHGEAAVMTRRRHVK